MNSKELANLNRLKKVLAEATQGVGGVEKSYVDARDAETLSDAKSYTNTSMVGVPNEVLTNMEIEALLK